ncbi:MAG TPA: hypothetical protein HPP94_07180 [Desulfuromonadales bacterium]|nr:hypothetical protein [Desulfuromonadales bacterium]
MGFDLRYNLQNIGTLFAIAVQKTADSAKACSKGVFLTYDITLLKSKKQKLSCEIGARVAVLMQEGKINLAHDAALSELIAQLEAVEQDLALHESQRSSLIDSLKVNKQGANVQPIANSQ